MVAWLHGCMGSNQHQRTSTVFMLCSFYYVRLPFREAITAIERAADVRTSFIAAPANHKDILVKDIAVDQLFRAELCSANDAPLQYNATPPRLGDRVVNLTATGVPFGLRGTVVVIHSSTEYVEVSSCPRLALLCTRAKQQYTRTTYTVFITMYAYTYA
jgi:Xrn1 SH3-like domain